jgi:hypothetical protein
MQFPENSTISTTLCCFKYCTYMNAVSMLDKLCMWLLQQQNVKRDAIEKKIAPAVIANANANARISQADHPAHPAAQAAAAAAADPAAQAD